MLKFGDFKYERIELNAFMDEMDALLERFDDAQSGQEQIRIFERINKLRNHAYTMCNLCYVRHSIDTRDAHYTKEQDFVDELEPELSWNFDEIV